MGEISEMHVFNDFAQFSLNLIVVTSRQNLKNVKAGFFITRQNS